MTPQQEIHVRDTGTIFEVTLVDGGVVVDVSSATVKRIIFENPERVVSAHDAAFTTDGTDGKIQYATVLQDLNISGDWKLQAHVALPTGNWWSDIQIFKVYPNLTI